MVGSNRRCLLSCAVPRPPRRRLHLHRALPSLPVGLRSPPPHRGQRVIQLGVQRSKEVGEQAGARPQRGIVAPKHQA